MLERNNVGVMNKKVIRLRKGIRIPTSVAQVVLSSQKMKLKKKKQKRG